MSTTSIELHKNDYSFVLINALWFLIGYHIFDWSSVTIIISFFVETMLILGFSFLKILVSCFLNPMFLNQGLMTNEEASKNLYELNTANRVGNFFKLMFVTLIYYAVYTLFTWGQAYVIFDILKPIEPAFKGLNYIECFEYMWSNHGFRASIIGMVSINIFYFVFYFLIKKEVLKSNFQALFTSPAYRVFTQQLLVVLGSSLIFKLNIGEYGLGLLFIIFKIIADFMLIEYLNKYKVKKI